jgi:hypothetical protein
MATYYWVLGSGTWDGSNSANWSTATGPTRVNPSNLVPSSGDTVVFNTNSAAASYVVTVSGAPYCSGITTTAPAAGTLTFQSTLGTSGAGGIPANQAPLFTLWEATTVNIHAACLFNNPDNASYCVQIYQTTGNNPPATQTITFNGGAGAAKVYYEISGGSSFANTFNFCSAQTITFAGVYIQGNSNSSVTCTGSTITIANSLTDLFYIYGANNLTLTTTTVNMGSATPVASIDAYIYFNGSGTIAVSSLSINCVRTYNTVTVYGSGTTITNLTLRGKTTSSTASIYYVTGQSGTTTLVDIIAAYGQGLGPTAFTGAVTLNSATLTIFNAVSTLTFGSTFTANSLGTTGAGSKFLLDGSSYSLATLTFTGAVSIVGTTGNAELQLGTNYFSAYYSTTAVNFSSTLTINMSSGYTAYLTGTQGGSGQTVTVAGATSLTNTDVNGRIYWVQSGVSTLTTTSAPTTTQSTYTVYSLSMGTGAASFTSTQLTCSYFSPVTGKALNSSGAVTVNNGSLANGAYATFTYYDVSFVAATLVTWTDTYILIPGVFTVTGAGGFTSTNTYTKTYGGLYTNYGVNITGPFSMTNAPSAFYCDTLTVGGNFSCTYSAAIGYSNLQLLTVLGLATISGTCTVSAPASAFFSAYIGSLQLTSGATSFTNINLNLAGSSATGSRSFYSTGTFTVNNSTVGGATGSTFYTYTSVACSAFSINNVSTLIGLGSYGTLTASSSTSYTSGASGSSFSIQTYNQPTSFGALTTNGGSLTMYSGYGIADETITVTTITTTNTTLVMDRYNVTATGAVSVTGDTLGTNSASFNVLIGSSTVSFTNLLQINIAGVFNLAPTHTLKGTTLTVNSSSLAASVMNVGTANYAAPVTFTGLATFNNVLVTFGGYYNINPVVTVVGLTLTKGTYASTGVTFTPPNSGLLTHSIGALTAASGGTITAYSTTVISTGAITATNLVVNGGAWSVAGTASFASSPTSATTTASFEYFINGAFTTTFTSYDVTLTSSSPSGPSLGSAFYSTGNLVLDDSGRASAGSLISTSGSGSIVFVTGATVTTWNKKSIQIADMTATGAGGLTLTSSSSSDQAGLSSTGNISITGPLTLTNQKFSGGSDAFVCVALSVGGAFTANNSLSAGANTWVRLTSAAITGATTFTKVGLFCSGNYASTGVASFTGEGSANYNYDNTFTEGGTLSTAGTSNLTIADYYSISLNTVTAGGSLSLTHASQIPYANCSGNITQSQVAGTTTVTRVRLAGSSASTFTSNGTMTMSTSAALHGFLTISGAAVTSNAGSGNYSCISAGDITFTGAVALTNTNFWASSYVASGGTGAITITGGASKPFSFTIDANAIPLDSYTSTFNIGISGTYPGMTFNSFTLSNTGSTFSVTSATVYKRPLICFDQSSSTSAVISIPSGVTPTLTNVDFWRVSPGGTSTKPWTGTSLGRVGGAITNLTTTAPKSAYYVGGAGSWEGAKWATSSGGTGATANYPLPQDNINFDANSGGGTVTVPASIRIGSLFLAGTSPGLTRISPSSTGSSVSAEIWVCSGISGPPTDPGIANLFYLGDTTSTTPIVVFVDGGSSDTVTVTNSQNMAIASGGYIRYMNAGTLSLPEVYYVGTSSPSSFSPLVPGYSSTPIAIDASTRVVNLTASTFTISQFFQIAQGTFNLGNCSITTTSFRIYSGTVAIPSTPYTCNVSSSYTLNATVTESIGGGNAAHLGKLVYTVGTTLPTFSSTVNDPTFLSVVVSDSTSSTITFRITALGSTYRLYTLSTFNVTNNSGGTFNFTNTTGSAITLFGVAGARNQWTGITIGSATASARINASPVSPATWYYSGGSLGSGQTGWNAGTAPAANTGFFFF